MENLISIFLNQNRFLCRTYLTIWDSTSGNLLFEIITKIRFERILGLNFFSGEEGSLDGEVISYLMLNDLGFYGILLIAAILGVVYGEESKSILVFPT